MKNKYIFSLFLSFMIASFTYGQPQLTFRYANLRINRISGTDYCEFDIQVKASVAGTYLWSGQAVVTFDNTTLSQVPTDWHATRGPLLSGTNTNFGAAKYPTLVTNTNGSAPTMTAIIAWGADNSVKGNGPNPSDFNEITTTYQTIVTVDTKITSTTGVAGISYIAGSMDTQEFYISAPSTFTNYLNPNLYDSRDILNTFVGRVYSNTYGWSQVGNAANGQWVNWTASVNTSVWDTIGGAAATISVANSQANNLTVHPGASLKILPGGELKVSGNTQINEVNGLWIASTIAGTGSWMDNGEASVTYTGSGSARIDRYVGSQSWHMIGIPLHSTFAQATFMRTYLKWYDESRVVPNAASTGMKWRYVLDRIPAPDSSLTGDLRGWSHWSSFALTGNFTIKYFAGTGHSIVSGPLTRALTRTQYTDLTFDGWNLVANMYPCPVDWNAASGWTKINVDPTIYYWSQSGGAYATYNGSTQIGTLGGTRYIPSMQGFFVHVTAAGTIGMDNPVKVFNSQAFWKDQNSYSELLDLNVEGSGYKDEAKIWFNSAATVNFDPEFDNYKLSGLDGAPQFYSLLADNNYASVNTLPWAGLNTVVPMGFSLKADDIPVTITASNLESFNPGTRIYLEDIKEATTQELTVNPVYSFTAFENDDANRFILHFYNPNVGVDNKNLSGMQIYSFENYVYVKNLVKGTTKGTIQMFDLLGRKVFQGVLKDMDLNKYLPGVNEGYYMVRVVTEDSSYSQKIYLK